MRSALVVLAIVIAAVAAEVYFREEFLGKLIKIIYQESYFPEAVIVSCDLNPSQGAARFKFKAELCVKPRIVS